MTSEVKELVERLQGLLAEDWASGLPWNQRPGHPRDVESAGDGQVCACEMDEDAELIVTAINALPTLLDTLQSQERRIGELEAALEEAKKPRFHEPGSKAPEPDLHPFFPNPKYPWFCKRCGYAEHEVLKHPQRTTHNLEASNG